MAHVPNEWLEIYKVVFGTMVKHPHCSAAFFATILLLTWWIIAGGMGNHEQTWKRPHGRLFAPNGGVHDIYNGSLESLFHLMNYQQIHFVAFYAPWSADSRNLVPEFFMTAKQFKNEVIFIAINCWIGSCRTNYTFAAFPRLYCYHTKRKPVEYLGPLDHYRMVKFLQSVLRPFTVIGHNDQMRSFLQSHEVVVLGYFHGPLTHIKDKYYSVFFDVCLASVNRANRVSFGLITKADIAKLVHLIDHGDLQLHNILEEALSYPKKSNYTVEDIHGWIYTHAHQVVVELTPNVSDLAFYKHQLQRGAALVLFLPFRSKRREFTFYAYEDTALKYTNCSCASESTMAEIETKKIARVLPNGDHAKTRNFCISTRGSTGPRKKTCLVEICQRCGHPCSMQDRTAFILNSLRSRTLAPRDCYQDEQCRSLPLTNYYYDDKVNVCHSKVAETEKEQKEDLVGLEDIREMNTLLSLIEGLQKVLSTAPLESMNLQALHVLNKKVQTLEHKKLETRGSFVKVEEKNRSSTPSERIKNKFRENCNATLNQKDIKELKQDASLHFLGLRCRTNRTLNFYYFDSDRYFSIAQGLGVNQSNLYDAKTAMAIVDIKTEGTYVFPEYVQIERSSVLAFIVNYTLGTLTRKLRSSSPLAKRICFEDNLGLFCYVEVSSQCFKDVVLNEDKDVLLLYTVSWCGHCKLANHLLLQLANIFRSITSLIFARIDGDKNDLPYEFTVDSFPTFVFFPANRKDNSEKYPDERPLSLEQLILFLSKWSSRTTAKRINGLLRASG